MRTASRVGRSSLRVRSLTLQVPMRESLWSRAGQSFDVIVSMVPPALGAVLLHAVVFGTELVVVWARSPALGWSTFIGVQARTDSWAVMEQIVDGGSQGGRGVNSPFKPSSTKKRPSTGTYRRAPISLTCVQPMGSVIF